jgi:hypothetical protein
MLDFFLWFWLLDRRYLCGFRPAIKYFSFLFLLPILSHSLTMSFNIFCLYPLTKLMDPAHLIVAFETILEMVSIICLIILIANLYNLSKKQPKKQKNYFVLVFEKIKGNKEDNYIYYEDYWMNRTILLSANGIIVLVASIINIAWSIFYVLHKNIFKEVFDWVEQYIIFVAYLNIFFFVPILLILFLAIVIKATFIVTAMVCPGFVVSLSGSCCKRNKHLNRTLDFSDVETLEPEFI